MAISHSYTFSHNKGIITFIDHDTEKSYDFNINTGIMTNAATGKQINSYPAGFVGFLENYNGEDCIIHFMNVVHNSPHAYGIFTPNGAYTLRNVSRMAEVAKFLTLLDRAQSLGATIGDSSSWRVFDTNNLRELDTYFKTFAKYCRETTKPTLDDFFHNGGKPYFICRNNLDKYHLTHEMQAEIYHRRHDIPVEDIPYYAYYLGRGVYDFFGGRSPAFDYIKNFLVLCKKLNVEPPKEDFFRSYINLNREYQMRRKAIDDATIARNYADIREALTFEDENYMVVIPQTREDFKAEAEAQRNCVYSIYLDKVLDGETHVVFVRRKDNPTKSLVTCEVRKGIIEQFLEKYNRSPSDELIHFSAEYQKHLDSFFCK